MAKLSTLYKAPGDSLLQPQTLDFMPEGIMIIDLMGYISYANPKFCNLVGYKKEQLVGLFYQEAAKKLFNTSDDLLDYFLEVLKGRKLTTKTQLEHRQGSSIPVHQFMNPVINDIGEITGAIYFFKEMHYELLLEITHAVNSSLNVKTIIETAVKTVNTHLGIYSCSIFLYHKDKMELEMVANSEMNRNDLKYFSYKLGEGAPGVVAAEKRPLYVQNMSTNPLIHHKELHDFQDSSCICFPLVSKGELQGVMNFTAYTVRDFTPQELFLFENIVNQLAMAIHNAKLYNITKKLSVTDGLTGLYNHQYFQRRLNEEIKRAQRNSNTLVLLMLDLDFFKQVNDHFGHPAGDKILKEVAQIMQKSLRTTDIVCRYGGEEFAVILVGCPEEIAFRLAEKIRLSIEGMQIGIEGVFKLTASIGLATFPYHAGDKKELIDAADKVLYKAKKRKNKVSIAKKKIQN